MPSKPKLLIAEPQDFSPEVLREIGKFAAVDARELKNREEVRHALVSYDIFWFRLGWTIDASVLSADSRCRIIATPVTGIDHIDLDLCRQLGIEVVCLKGEREFLKRIRATAEMTIALALNVMRHIPDARNAVLRGEWNRDEFRGRELFESRVGVIGCGRLGAIVAGYFLAMGAEVWVFDVREEVEVPEGAKRVNSMGEVLEHCNLVSLHVNFEQGSPPIIGTEELAVMKTGAYLINTSRGGLVDEDALLAALTEKRLGGAGLDVLQDEQNIGHDNPLIQYARSHRNLVIVPHIGGNTYESFERTEGFIADKVEKTWKKMFV